MPLNTDDKTEVLRKLQGSIHFERTLTGNSFLHRQSLPSWFVGEHGDKFREYVILRSRHNSGSTTTAWTVRLTVDCRPAKSTSVRFSAGWKAFATFHGLLEGDSLVFSLTATSEFEVYLFRGMAARSPKQFPNSRPPRIKRPYDSELAQKRAKRSHECRDIDGLAELNDLISKKKTEAVVDHLEEHPVSASGNSPNSSRRSSLMSGFDKKDGPVQHSDAARMKKENEYKASAL